MQLAKRCTTSPILLDYPANNSAMKTSDPDLAIYTFFAANENVHNERIAVSRSDS
jgi:hypothetical protein